MYATEKYLRLEIKHLLSNINELAADLGGDIRYLNEQLEQIRNSNEFLMKELTDLKEEVNSFKQELRIK